MADSDVERDGIRVDVLSGRRDRRWDKRRSCTARAPVQHQFRPCRRDRRKAGPHVRSGVSGGLQFRKRMKKRTEKSETEKLGTGTSRVLIFLSPIFLSTRSFESFYRQCVGCTDAFKEKSI